MKKKLSFRTKLFSYFTAIFIVFAALILLFQYEREKEFKREILEKELKDITEITQKYISNNSLQKNGNYRLLDSLCLLIPEKKTRITVISPAGIVLYDSKVADYNTMENHLIRPEVQQSIASGFGANIRKSATTGNSYYYYAKFYTEYFVRTATLYDIEIKEFLKAEKIFIIYIASLFAILLFVISLVTKNISKTVTKLKDFTIKLSSGKKYDKETVFHDDELGIISKRIIVLYNELNFAKEKITQANDKLFAHLQALNEGIAFFSSQKTHILSNKHFIQYLNLITDKSTISAENFFTLKQLEELIDFIDQKLSENIGINPNDLPYYEVSINKDGKYFNVWCTIFQDKSFEVVIKDTTKLKKRKLLKQQMTSNIAHELKTPVTTIMGYLETLNRNTLPEEKQQYFINKTYAQANRLSELIEDITVLTKIEESSELFTFERVILLQVLNEVIDNLKIQLEQKYISVSMEIQEDLILEADKSLMFSVFFNLFDNAIKYGGENIRIDIKNYHEDEKYYYFSFANTGSNIDKMHFPHIFERFYRIDSGRSRKTGGTGLGLSIVKNAIEMHSGEISVRDNKDNGVEFLFSLAKQTIK